ncbi:conserved hypothetical protein [Exiguobacterium sp. 8A]|nr:conserved hypothetical protein [Exiguobacterium sp. 8A]
MTKFTTDQKLSAVMAYREGKDSMNDIDYYNTRRIKAKLKLSPVQYRTQFVHVA